MSKGDEDDEEEDYIVVSEFEGGTALELPADAEGGLTLTTLSHSFPDAIGLKYKNASTGLYRTLGINADGTRIVPPKGGWKDKKFVAIFRNNSDTPEGRLKRRPSPPRANDSCKTARMDHESGGENACEMMRETNTCDLVVLNLSYKTTAEQLKAYFSKFGEVVIAEIKTDFQTGQPKGFGFVRMKELPDQQRILDQFEHFIDGRMTQLKVPNSRQSAGSSSGHGAWSGHNNPGVSSSRVSSLAAGDVISTKIHVGRLPPDVTEEDLSAFFDFEGKKLNPQCRVEQVFIPRPYRGFAFVSFNDADVARKMIALGDFVFNGVSISVGSAARKVDPRSLHTAPSSVSQQFRDYGGLSRPAGNNFPSSDLPPGGRYPPSNDLNYPPTDNRYPSSFANAYPSPSSYNNGGNRGMGNRVVSGPGPHSQTPSQMADGSRLQQAWSAFWSTLDPQQQAAAGHPPM